MEQLLCCLASIEDRSWGGVVCVSSWFQNFDKPVRVTPSRSNLDRCHECYEWKSCWKVRRILNLDLHVSWWRFVRWKNANSLATNHEMHHFVKGTLHHISLSDKGNHDSPLHHLRIRKKRGRRCLASQCNLEGRVSRSHHYQKLNEAK